MKRVLVAGILLGLMTMACGDEAKEFVSPEEIGSELTEQGLECDTTPPEKSDAKNSFAIDMNVAIEDLEAAIAADRAKYNAAIATCDIEDEFVVWYVFHSESDRQAFKERLAFEQRLDDPTYVLVLGSNWAGRMDTVLLAEKVVEAIGGDIES